MRPFPIRSLIPPPAARRVRLASRRSYAVQAPGAPTFEVFNRRTKLLQRERAAANAEKSREVDYLRDETAFRLCERLLVCPFFVVPCVMLIMRHRTSTAASTVCSTSGQMRAMLVVSSPSLTLIAPQ